MHYQNVKNGSLSNEDVKTFHRIMTLFSIFFIATATWGCSNSSSEPETNPTQVTLKLGGNDCEFYLGAVEAAIKKLNGIQKVDMKTQKGHAIVKTDGTLKASQVVDTVDGLSGDGWNCEAELQN